ncbi:unnamed protein product [Schistosoma margrebowiei]|uniref:Uncharacterized protein n=1 Tax=Schistosoma margrebowiei TaxID=48269 RepID=A0A183N097_9TREM|nr:unnamed protein product [Schistosoma margrebowiei]
MKTILVICKVKLTTALYKNEENMNHLYRLNDREDDSHS